MFTQNVIIHKMLGRNPYSLTNRQLMDWRLSDAAKQLIGNLQIDDLYFNNIIKQKEEKSAELDDQKA